MFDNLDSRFSSVRLRSWGLRGGFAILDQGLFSTSNFLLNILLARWLVPEDYGAFSVAFTSYLVLLGIYHALILDPMSVLGPSKYHDRLKSYFSDQAKTHWALAAIFALSLISIGGVMLANSGSAVAVSAALLGAGLAIPFMLFIWLTRRMYYISQYPQGAAAASFVYSVILLGGLLLLRSAHQLSAFGGYLILALAGLIGGLVFVGWRQHGLFHPSESGKWQVYFADHWALGKWLLMGIIPTFFTGQVQVYLAASYLDLEMAGALRAMQNLINPAMQIIVAIATLALPSLSYNYGRRDHAAFRQKASLFLVAITGMSLLYVLGLWAFARPLQNLLYGTNYEQYAGAIPLLGISLIAYALAVGYAIPLRALQRPQYLLLAAVLTLVIGSISSFGFIRLWGLPGAIWSINLTSILSFVIAFLYYRRETSEPARESDASS